MAYSKTTWTNGAAPAINATNLNKIEQGIYDAHAAIDPILPLTDQFVVTTETFSMSISASSYGDSTQTFTKSGYYPIGVVGWSITGASGTQCFIPRLYLSSVSNGTCDLFVRVRNTATAAASLSFGIRILWIKIS